MAYFSWDPKKEWMNRLKHGVDFKAASRAFEDPRKRILTDHKHGGVEDRFFCIGQVDGRILMVRFVYRGDEIRIFGAGCWRKGRRIYETKKKV